MKNYVCEFCGYVTPLFNNLKLHIKKNHLEAPPKADKRSKSREQLTNKKRSTTNDRISAERTKDNRISLNDREDGNEKVSNFPCKTKRGRTGTKKETEKTKVMNAEDLRIKETTRLLNSDR